MFDLRLLHTLVTVAEHHSFVRAAEALYATQPGVSQQIARLEAHLGARLLNRGAGPVELTPAGAAVLARARSILAAVEALEDEASGWACGEAGALTIGLSSSVVTSQIPTRIKSFKLHRPRLRLDVTVRSADELMPLLDIGALDAVVTTLPSDSADYLGHIVDRQHLGVAVPDDHWAARHEQISIDELIAENFIVVPRSRDRAIHDALIARAQHAGHALRIVAEEVAFPNVIARVALGDGIGLVPVQFAPNLRHGVVVVNLLDDEFTLPVTYLTRHGSGNLPAHALLEHLTAATDPAEYAEPAKAAS